MGQYKVPQNVEAEDKIIGPLTFKQFIYALVGVFWGLLSFAFLHTLIPVMLVVGIPPTGLFLLLAFFNRDGQNFEQLLLALVNFTVNPRRRLWNKDEYIASFRVEPAKHEVEQTQRNPAEVRSRLEQIAGMVDSRGWETTNASLGNLIAPSSPAPVVTESPASGPIALATEPAPSEDILDFQHSPLALNLTELINNAADDVRAEALEQMRAPTPAKPAAPTVTPISASGILELATENDDLTVAQLAMTATHLVPPEAGQADPRMEKRGSK